MTAHSSEETDNDHEVARELRQWSRRRNRTNTESDTEMSDDETECELREWMSESADEKSQSFNELFYVGETVTVEFDNINSGDVEQIAGVVTKPTPTEDTLYVADDEDNRYKLEERIGTDTDSSQVTVLETGGRIPSVIGRNAFVFGRKTDYSDNELSFEELKDKVVLASETVDTSATNDDSATGDDQFDTSAYGKHSRGVTTNVVSGAKTSVPDADTETTVNADADVDDVGDDETPVTESADVADEGSELDDTDEQVIDRLKEIHNNSHDSIDDYVSAESLIKMQNLLRRHEQHEYEDQYQKYQYQKQEKEQDQDQETESSSDSDTNTIITCEEDALSDTVSISEPMGSAPVRQEDTWKLIPSSEFIQSIDISIEDKTINIDINTTESAVMNLNPDVSVTSQTDSESTTESASASTTDADIDIDTDTDSDTDSDTDTQTAEACLSNMISEFRSTDDDE